MLKRQIKLPKLFLALLGLLFGSLVLLSSTPVIAAPEDTTNTTETADSTEETTEETTENSENTATTENTDDKKSTGPNCSRC